MAMAFIFYMSSRSIEVSRSDSAWLITVLKLVEHEEDLYKENDWEMFKLHNAVRKYAHVVMYAGLGMLYFASMYGYFGGIRVTGAVATLLTAVYGATDEFHQLFTHRGAVLGDVLIDTLGGLAGIILIGSGFIIIEKNKGLKSFFSRLYDFEPKKTTRGISWKKSV